MGEPSATHLHRVGIDTGGTFTDIVAVNNRTGEMTVTKVPSTPDNPARGLVDGVASIRDAIGAADADIAALCHGTTLATNALLEDRFMALGLITTRGFRHVLEIARQSVPEGYGNSYFWVKPERIVPLSMVREIDERLTYEGAVLRPLDEASVFEAADFFRRRGVTAIGVCLLHAYANPGHEQEVRRILIDTLPGVDISISSDVLPEYREYERTVTTLVDAFIKPKMNKYMGDIRRFLPETLRQKPFLVMKSNGGVAGVEAVRERPIMTALSGPAAGALGAAVFSKLAGFPRVVTLDAGGTSTDLCLVEDGEPHLTTTGSIGRFPVKVSMIDIVSVGTGGGSIAWRNREGRLAVGPRSAGAKPGPMCYPDGGSEPTITDANIVLGRLPAGLIGGGIPLDAEPARDGMRALGRDLGMDGGPEEIAAGIIEVANWSQANAIRQLIVRRGIAAGDLALMSFGGSGPAQSAEVMDLIGFQATIVPVNPGNVSAFGLLAVDWRTDHVVTKVMRDDDADPETIGAQFTRLEAEAGVTLDRDGVARDARRLIRYIDARYEGQADELRVPVPPGAVDQVFVSRALDAFHDAHEQLYGYAYRGDQHVEIINLAVSGFGRITRPDLHPRDTGGGTRAVPAGERKVYFRELGGFVEAPVYDRSQLPAGAEITGPAIIEEFGSTTVLFDGQSLTTDGYGTFIIRPKGYAGKEGT